MCECFCLILSILSLSLSLSSSPPEKPIYKCLDDCNEAERRFKYVLLGPVGVGKSVLAIKVAA